MFSYLLYLIPIVLASAYLVGGPICIIRHCCAKNPRFFAYCVLYVLFWPLMVFGKPKVNLFAEIIRK